jgi:hypothetical protein
VIDSLYSSRYRPGPEVPPPVVVLRIAFLRRHRFYRRRLEFAAAEVDPARARDLEDAVDGEVEAGSG